MLEPEIRENINKMNGILHSQLENFLFRFTARRGRAMLSAHLSLRPPHPSALYRSSLLRLTGGIALRLGGDSSENGNINIIF